MRPDVPARAYEAAARIIGNKNSREMRQNPKAARRNRETAERAVDAALDMMDKLARPRVEFETVEHLPDEAANQRLGEAYAGSPVTFSGREGYWLIADIRVHRVHDDHSEVKIRAVPIDEKSAFALISSAFIGVASKQSVGAHA